MTSVQDVSTESSLNQGVDVFEFNIIVLGLLAAMYGPNSGKSPVRGWGGGHQRPVLCDGKWFTVSTYRYKQNGTSVPGFRFEIRTEDKQKVLLDKFYPWDSLDKIAFEIEGGIDL